MNRADFKQPAQKSILLAKLGTLPELSGIVTELAKLLPDTRLLGIGAEGVSPSPHLEVVAHERQLVLGAFDAWWDEQLYVDPDLYVRLLPKESQLLRTVERVVRHDVFQVDKPSFPTEPFRDTFEGSASNSLPLLPRSSTVSVFGLLLRAPRGHGESGAVARVDSSHHSAVRDDPGQFGTPRVHVRTSQH
jgi:hypothetical protein